MPAMDPRFEWKFGGRDIYIYDGFLTPALRPYQEAGSHTRIHNSPLSTRVQCLPVIDGWSTMVKRGDADTG